jgi:hypothetical protein
MSWEVLAMTPAIILLLAAIAASDGDATPRPSALPAQARTLRPLARTELGRAFLKAAEDAPPYAPRTVYRRSRTRDWLDAAAFARLTAVDRQDNPTIRRIVHFTRLWGFDGLTVVNL